MPRNPKINQLFTFYEYLSFPYPLTHLKPTPCTQLNPSSDILAFIGCRRQRANLTGTSRISLTFFYTFTVNSESDILIIWPSCPQIFINMYWEQVIVLGALGDTKGHMPQALPPRCPKSSWKATAAIHRQLYMIKAINDRLGEAVQ